MFQSTGRLMRLSVRRFLAMRIALCIAILNLLPCRGLAGETPKKPQDERPPFDLTYVPPEATGVIALRPSAIFGKSAMKPLAGIANQGLAELRQYLKLSAHPKLPIEDIEEIVAYISKLTSNTKGKESTYGIMCGLVTIRAKHDFDWLKLMRQLDPKTEEIEHEGRVYYRCHYPKLFGDVTPSPKATFCFFIPDKRTIACLEGKTLIAFLCRNVQRPHFSWDEDWKRVEHGLIAVAVDKRWANGVPKQIGDGLVPIWPSLVRNAPLLVAGLDWMDRIDFQAFLTCKNKTAAKQIRRDIRDVLGLMRFAMNPAADYIFEAVTSSQKKETNSVPPETALQERLWENLMKHTHVTRQENTVCVHTATKLTIIDVAKLLMFDPPQQKKP